MHKILDLKFWHGVVDTLTMLLSPFSLSTLGINNLKLSQKCWSTLAIKYVIEFISKVLDIFVTKTAQLCTSKKHFIFQLWIIIVNQLILVLSHFSYYDATVDSISDDLTTCTVSFDKYGNTEIVKVHSKWTDCKL